MKALWTPEDYRQMSVGTLPCGCRALTVVGASALIRDARTNVVAPLTGREIAVHRLAGSLNQVRHEQRLASDAQAVAVEGGQREETPALDVADGLNRAEHGNSCNLLVGRDVNDVSGRSRRGDQILAIGQE
jgi:hypothetical protein